MLRRDCRLPVRGLQQCYLHLIRKGEILAPAQNKYKKLIPLAGALEKNDDNKIPYCLFLEYLSNLPLSTCPSIGLELKLY